MDAIKNQPNVPGDIGPFIPQPGLTTEAQYIMVEPSPQPQPALPDFIKWFITTLSEEISGALPSLFGNATGENTVGNAVIQRDQAPVSYTHLDVYKRQAQEQWQGSLLNGNRAQESQSGLRFTWLLQR